MSVVVTNIARPAADVVRALGAFGVATVHEAQDRTGLLAASIRPIYRPIHAVGRGDHLLGGAGRQLDDSRGRRAMPSGRCPGRVANERVRGRLLRRLAGHVARGARRGRPRDRRRRARRRPAHRDALPGLVEGGLRTRHGQGNARRREPADRLRRCARQSRRSHPGRRRRGRHRSAGGRRVGDRPGAGARGRRGREARAARARAS